MATKSPDNKPTANEIRNTINYLRSLGIPDAMQFMNPSAGLSRRDITKQLIRYLRDRDTLPF